MRPTVWDLSKSSAVDDWGVKRELCVDTGVELREGVLEDGVEAI